MIGKSILFIPIEKAIVLLIGSQILVSSPILKQRFGSPSPGAMGMPIVWCIWGPFAPNNESESVVLLGLDPSFSPQKEKKKKEIIFVTWGDKAQMGIELDSPQFRCITWGPTDGHFNYGLTKRDKESLTMLGVWRNFLRGQITGLVLNSGTILMTMHCVICAKQISRPKNKITY